MTRKTPMIPSREIEAIPIKKAIVRKLISMFDISVETANTIYIWAYVALIVGAILTVGGLLSLFWSEGVRNKHHETQFVAAQKQRADDKTIFDAETARMKQQLAEAKSAADAAQKHADELKRLREPRRLTEIQKTKFVSFLTDKTKGKLIIKANVSAPDAKTYGDEIGTLLRDRLGWTVRVDNAIITGADISDICIVVRNPGAPPPATQELLNAFNYASIPMRQPEYDPTGPAADEIWLQIGAKK